MRDGAIRMKNRRPDALGMICLCLGFFALQLAMLLSIFHAVGTDGGLYYRLQLQAGILSQSGLSEADLRRLDGALADYLAGDAGAIYDQNDGSDSRALSIPVEVFGNVQPAFNARELVHMEDCYDLFALMRRMRAAAFILAGLMLALGLSRARSRGILAGGLVGLALLLVPVGLLGVWAAIDFEGAFVFFHKMLFTNDLWLLNPQTDLLIRICPESMFAGLGLRIGSGWLVCELGMMLILGIIHKMTGKRNRG